MKSCKSEDSVAKVQVKEEDKKLIRNQINAQNMLAIPMMCLSIHGQATR